MPPLPVAPNRQSCGAILPLPVGPNRQKLRRYIAAAGGTILPQWLATMVLWRRGRLGEAELVKDGPGATDSPNLGVGHQIGHWLAQEVMSLQPASPKTGAGSVSAEAQPELVDQAGDDSGKHSFGREQELLLAAAILGSAALLWRGRRLLAGAFRRPVFEQGLGAANKDAANLGAVNKDGLAALLQKLDALTNEPPRLVERDAALGVEEPQATSTSFEPSPTVVTNERYAMYLHYRDRNPLSYGEVQKIQYIDGLPRKTVPEYCQTGLLVPAVYRMARSQFRAFFGGNACREELLANFEKVLQKLKEAGVKEVHVGGSFVSTKPLPNDIDFAWNMVEAPFERTVLEQYENGALLQHDSMSLKSMGLQNLVEPDYRSSYKGILHFLAHVTGGKPAGALNDWNAANDINQSMMVAPKFPSTPKGIVEIDLSGAS